MSDPAHDTSSAPTRPARPPRVTIVVARARDGVIGADNGLPWHLPEDLKHFRATTMGHAIVMGRKTFESIGKALPGRRTIVVSRDPRWAHPGCESATTLREAIALAGRPGPDPAIATDEVFVVGGAQLYRDAIAIAQRAIVTEIEIDVAGDVHFPELDRAQWHVASRSERQSSSGLRYTIVDYRRN
ncbi:MAG: dihydrofolate reductase [Burkholderiaceae bacterium]|nr:dihydrofolate reductase [Burkholderiaceae bacterium]